MTSRPAAHLPYGERETTAWLAWLARGMRRHGQTVFLIEDLQPSWLSRRADRLVYVLASRLAGSLVFGLAFGLFGLFKGGELLVFGVSAGAIAGLGVGLIDFFRLPATGDWRRLDPIAISIRALGWTLLFSLMGSAGVFVGHAAVELEPTWPPHEARFFSFLFALLLGVSWGARAHRRGLVTDIQRVDLLAWSWRHAGRNAAVGLTLGIGALLAIFSSSQADATKLVAAGVVFFFILIGFFFGGLRQRTGEASAVPNQGIRLSLKSSWWALAMGPIVALLLAIFLALLWLLLGHRPEWMDTARLVGSTGLSVGIIAALRYGGLAVIQHYILRFMLVLRGRMPWRYAEFLDYAAEELELLQKVGGGYLFVHRHLLDYFADLEKPGGSIPGRQV